MKLLQSASRGSRAIGLDFDKTCVTDAFPEVGEPITGCLEILKRLQLKHKIILITQRDGKELEDAIKYLESNGIKLYGVNENPDQKAWNSSRKIYADFYIDDKNLGVPKDAEGNVVWKGHYSIESILEEEKLLQPAV